MTAAVKTAHKKLYPGLLCALWVISLASSLAIPASWDVAWRLEISQRLLNTSVLYRDIIELNPPLWFWSIVPSTYVAGLLNVSPYSMMCVTIHLTLIPSLWLFDRCLAPLVSRNERAWLVIGSLVALVFIPINQLGQREPPVLFAGLLWATLAVRRAKNLPSPRWMALGVALLSAYGFALKHYYLVIPIGFELWLLWQMRCAWRPVRTETVTLALLGITYAGAVLAFAPNFLTDIVPLIQLSYEDVRSANVASPWRHPLFLLSQSLFLIAPIYFIRDIVRLNHLAQALFLAIILQVLVVLIQGKGFGNHFLAAKGTAFVLWAFACGCAPMNTAKVSIHPKAALAIWALAWIWVPAAAISKTPTYIPASSPLPEDTTLAVIQTVVQEPKSSRVFVVSTNAGLAFYIQWSLNRPHFSRYYAMWMFPGLLTSQLMPERHANASAQLDLVRTNTIADIQCAAPHLIIGDTTEHGRVRETGAYAYDIKPMLVLLTDTEFKSWIDANYAETTLSPGVTIWRSKLAAGPAQTNCPAKRL